MTWLIFHRNVIHLAYLLALATKLQRHLNGLIVTIENTCSVNWPIGCFLKAAHLKNSDIYIYDFKRRQENFDAKHQIRR